jgi:hypothetical protein
MRVYVFFRNALAVFKRLLRWENEIGTSFVSVNPALVS